MSESRDRSLRAGCRRECPGCAHRHLSQEESEGHKEAWVRRQLDPWREAVRSIRAADRQQRWGYRERVCLAAERSGQGWAFGLRRREALIAIPDCPVHSERVRRLADLLATRLPGPPFFPLIYFVQSGAQLTLIVKTAAVPAESAWLDAELAAELEGLRLEGLWLHLFPSVGRKIFAKNGWRLLWGVPRSRDEDGLAYGPTAFRQLLPGLFRDALDEAETFLDPGRGHGVVDLYCGTGATLRRWTARGARAIGVELSGESVTHARENVPEADVLRGCCATRIPQLDAWLNAMPGVRLLYVNPPRTGLEPEIADWIAIACQPARMAYLSCSAGTLRRDLEGLCSAGYQVEGIIPYDFFPQTHHVETLALLSRRPGSPAKARAGGDRALAVPAGV